MTNTELLNLTASETARRTTNTGRTPEGDRLREENWDGETCVWNCSEGRNATEEEVARCNWRR